MDTSHARRLPPRLTRRQALGRFAGLGAVLSLGPLAPALPSRPLALRPPIRPRSDWAGELAPTGPIEAEEDVRFLLVHHTASTNDYTPDQVADQIRGFYQFHTGPEKGWPDVAYNFFVDRFGGIWEGRQGSAAGPVRGNATGGSQGFSQLCSLIGNHQEAPVTPEQQASLTQLLAWLGQTYAVDTTPGTTVTFVSRGSNRWPAGELVTARTISGHRDMSTTTCPGDLAYALIGTELPTAVSALRAAVGTAASTAPPVTSLPTTAPSSTGPPATTTPTTTPTTATATTGTPTTGTPTTGTRGTAASSAAIGAEGEMEVEVATVVDGPVGDGGQLRSRYLVAGSAGAGALAVLTGWVARRRRPTTSSAGDPPGRPLAADDEG